MKNIITLVILVIAFSSCNSTSNKKTAENSKTTTSCCSKTSCDKDTKESCAKCKKDGKCNGDCKKTGECTCSKGGKCTKTTCCSKTTNNSSSKLVAYYFHNTHRCTTCKAVEDVTKEALKNLNLNLQSINLQTKEGKELAKKFGVRFQSLLIMKGDEIKNLTNEAFLTARTKPEVLKEKIKETVNALRK